MDKINLQHVILYAKGWYLPSTNIFADMQKCLNMDGYSGEFLRKDDINRILLRQIQKRKTNESNLFVVLDSIRKENSWKHGYYTKESAFPNLLGEDLPDFDYDVSIIKYCLCVFSDLDNDEWDMCEPDYVHCLPKRIPKEI